MLTKYGKKRGGMVNNALRWLEFGGGSDAANFGSFQQCQPD